MGVDLSARYWLYPQTKDPFEYCVYGAACSEAIVDVLTGETQILRTDILYDGGQRLVIFVNFTCLEWFKIQSILFELKKKIFLLYSAKKQINLKKRFIFNFFLKFER